MNDDLLQRLVQETKFTYLSDLHSPHHIGSVYSAVSRVKPQEYSTEEWEKAIGYIIDQKGRKFDTQKAAYKYLLHELEVRKPTP